MNCQPGEFSVERRGRKGEKVILDAKKEYDHVVGFNHFQQLS